jgi:hypothetical protein
MGGRRRLIAVAAARETNFNGVACVAPRFCVAVG